MHRQDSSVSVPIHSNSNGASYDEVFGCFSLICNVGCSLDFFQYGLDVLDVGCI